MTLNNTPPYLAGSGFKRRCVDINKSPTFVSELREPLTLTINLHSQNCTINTFVFFFFVVLFPEAGSFCQYVPSHFREVPQPVCALAPSNSFHQSCGAANRGAKGYGQIWIWPTLLTSSLYLTLQRNTLIYLGWWSRCPWWQASSLIAQEAAPFAITGIEEGCCNCQAPNRGIAVSTHPSRLL